MININKHKNNDHANANEIGNGWMDAIRKNAEGTIKIQLNIILNFIIFNFYYILFYFSFSFIRLCCIFILVFRMIIIDDYFDV